MPSLIYSLNVQIVTYLFESEVESKLDIIKLKSGSFQIETVFCLKSFFFVGNYRLATKKLGK